MKKIIALILALTLCLSLFGCGKTDSPANTPDIPDNGEENGEEVKFSKDDKLIAFSFDDGPDTNTTPKVLDLFAEYDGYCTFFLIGNHINDDTAEIIKRAYDEGHEIGNHTKDHMNLANEIPPTMEEQVSYVQDKVKEIIGVEPTLFRPPFLAVSPAMHENIGLTFIFGRDSQDWTDISEVQRYENVMKFADDGIIVLMHDGYNNERTVAALELLLPELHEQGYKFCTISQLFEAKGITPEANSGVIYSAATENGQ